jgi:hypothetical protein
LEASSGNLLDGRLDGDNPDDYVAWPRSERITGKPARMAVKHQTQSLSR